MEARYEARKRALLDECSIAPEIFDEVMPRLEQFMEPFVESFVRTEQVGHARTPAYAGACCRIWTTRMPSRLPIVSARIVCRYNGSSAFRPGMLRRCATS